MPLNRERLISLVTVGKITEMQFLRREVGKRLLSRSQKVSADKAISLKVSSADTGVRFSWRISISSNESNVRK
jgi:hypothetical protein